MSLYFFVVVVAVLGNHSTSPIFVKGVFEIGSHGTICLGWL
jgi:hypothetical protein